MHRRLSPPRLAAGAAPLTIWSSTAAPRAPLCLLSLVVPLPAPEAAPNRRIGARQSAAAGDDVTWRHHADVAALRGRDPTGQRLKLLAGKTQAGEKRFGPFSEI